MKTLHRKSRSAKPRRRIPEIPLNPIYYRPTLEAWKVGTSLIAHPGLREVSICDRLENGMGAGREIFRIQLDPSLSDESVKRIVGLIEFAPELWQELRHLGRFQVDEGPEGFLHFGYIAGLLSEATGGLDRPFDFPVDDESEKFDARKTERDRQLADRAWRQRMASPEIETVNRLDGPTFKCRRCGHYECVPYEMIDHLREKHHIRIGVGLDRVSIARRVLPKVGNTEG
jgi:hypothetical protein